MPRATASRLRRAILSAALALAAAAALPGGAAAQSVEFRGFSYVSDFNAACVADGWTGTPSFYVRYRPFGLGSNTDSRLAFFDRFYASGYRLADRRFDRTWRDVDAGQVGSSLWAYDAGTSQVRVTTHAPATLTDSTPQIRLVGQIRGWGGVPGCTARFEATVMRHR